MILDIVTVLCFVGGLVLLFGMIKQGRDRGPYAAKTGKTDNLILRPIAPNEYAVLEDGNPVGAIMRAGEPRAEVWLWNCSLPGHGVSSGTAVNLEDAQARFRQEWKKRKIGLQQLNAKGK